MQARRLEVVRLTRIGATLREIAGALDISHETVRKDRMAMMQQMAKEQLTGIAEMRTLYNDRYERQFREHWVKSIDRTDDNGVHLLGEDKAHDKVMNILAALRKMNGVDEMA